MNSWRGRWLLMAVVVFAVSLLIFLLSRDTMPEDDQASSARRDAEVEPREAPSPLLTGLPRTPADVPASAESAATLAGVVESEAGEPIAEAEVKLRLSIERSSLSSSTPTDQTTASSCTTDSEGRFLFSVKATEMDYRLSAQAEGYQRKTVKAHVPADGLEGLTIVLEAACVLEGRVLDATGRRPLADVVVVANEVAELHEFSTVVDGQQTTAFEYSGGESAFESSPTSETGEFSFYNLPPGEWRLGAREPSRRTTLSQGSERDALAVVSLRTGERRYVQLIVPTVSSDLVIGGLVQTEGRKPISGAHVWACQGPGQSPDRALSTTRSDEMGRFSMDRFDSSVAGVGPTPLCVSCQAEGYEPVTGVSIPFGTTDVVITMVPEQRGVIRGRVLDALTRKPVTDGDVFLWQVCTTWGDRSRPGLRDYLDSVQAGKGHVDDMGAFELNDVQAGLATLLVHAKGYGAALYDGVSVRVGETTGVEILLAAAGELEVHVIPTGSLAEEEAECWLELSPVGPNSLEDDSRWMPPGVSSKNGAIGSPRGMTASQRFTVACGELTGQSIAYKARGPRVATFQLQPGDYTVRASMRGKRPFRIGDRVLTLETAKVYRQVTSAVASGHTAVVELELGGMGMVQGSVAQPGSEATHLMVLTPGERPEFFTAHQSVTEYDLEPLILQAMEEAMFVRPRGGAYTFDYVPSGTYTVSAYTATNQGYDLCGTSVITVADAPVTVDF